MRNVGSSRFKNLSQFSNIRLECLDQKHNCVNPFGNSFKGCRRLFLLNEKAPQCRLTRVRSAQPSVHECELMTPYLSRSLPWAPLPFLCRTCSMAPGQHSSSEGSSLTGPDTASLEDADDRSSV